jgi:ribonuclease HI
LGNPGPAGIGVVFHDGKGGSVRQLSKYVGETTNNVAEYLAFVYAIEEARACGLTRLRVKTDSELLARQITGSYRVRDATLRLLHDLALHMMRRFERCEIHHVPRELNQQADRLAGRAAKSRAL